MFVFAVPAERLWMLGSAGFRTRNFPRRSMEKAQQIFPQLIFEKRRKIINFVENSKSARARNLANFTPGADQD